MYLSIIIPAYNEEERIGKTLQRIHYYMQKNFFRDYEVIAVDNGSTDSTKEIIRSYSANWPELRLLQRKDYGKGWAVREGMLEAKGEWRLFTDADNSTDIRELAKLIQHSGKYDVIVSSRRISGAEVIHPQKGVRKVLGNIFSGIVHFLVPVHVKDTQNGFKLFSKKAAEQIFSHQTIFYWAFDVEVLALAEIYGFKVKEVPIRWVNDEKSKMNFKGMMKSLAEVWKVHSNLLSHNY